MDNSNNLYKLLSDIDHLSPLERINLPQFSLVKSNCEKVLLALNVVDETLHQLKPKKMIYLYNEAIFYSFLKNIIHLSEEEFKQSLIYLDLFKLVYRFTCAKKFLIKENSVFNTLLILIFDISKNLLFINV